MVMASTTSVIFDCDGVLVDSVSSWRTLHDHFGTDNSDELARFIAGEISDVEFMRSDIRKWKAVQAKIHRDDLFRCYAGQRLMPGTREVMDELRARGIKVAIVSAGVDLFVASIASMLDVDDWIANGFEFDDEGWLLEDGICRLRASGKGDPVQRFLTMNDLDPSGMIAVGDSGMDLSMHVDGSTFIGFCPTRPSGVQAFADAGVPVVTERDLRGILTYVKD